MSAKKIRSLLESYSEIFENDKVIARGEAKTAGNGLWSRKKAEVSVELKPAGDSFLTDDSGEIWGQINAYFTAYDWNVDKDGLIYTDGQFIEDIKDILKNAGFENYEFIDYSEQGMQGRNYVNLDVGHDLAEEMVDKGLVSVRDVSE